MVENLPLVSIVTTCKGRLKYLKKSLNTWLDLNYSSYEIIIVDYDDPDGTEAYINREKKKLMKNSLVQSIRVIKIDNRKFFNLNDARNVGVVGSWGKLILMIDSDVFIQNKNILKSIVSKYKKGTVFFSTQVILNSNFIEAVSIYRSYYKVNIESPVLVPIGTVIPGLNGTACYLKSMYLECGRYDSRISEIGYGQDENEFYLRYLANYFLNYFLPSKKGDVKVEDLLNMSLADFYTFPLKWFKNLDNTDEEKEMYYPSSKEASFQYNIRYIRNFFAAFKRKFKDQKVKIGFQALGKWKENLKIFPLKIPSEFTLQWYSLLAKQYFNQGSIDKAELIIKKIYYNKKLPPKYKINCNILLGKIAVKKNNVQWKSYYRKSLKILESKEYKSFRENFQLGEIYAALKEYDKSKIIFQGLIRREGVSQRNQAACWFYIAELERKGGEIKWIAADKEGINLLNKIKNKNPEDLIQLAKKFKKIGDLNQAKEAYLNLIEITKYREDAIAGYLINLGEICRELKEKDWLEFNNRALKLLLKKKNKQDVDYYRIASLLKGLQEYESALEWFLDLQDRTEEPRLVAGSLFHQGEIYYRLKNKKKAEQLFKNCLEITSKHKKAKEYLIKLTKGE
jgi:glycosyltransferase involved in cell wall biosynthesis